jgi:hypothetical protein
MKHRQLIEAQSDDSFRITETGREFLIFLVKARLTNPKSL